MKNKKSKIVFIIIAAILITVSGFVGYFLGVKSSLYEGTSAKDWAADSADDEHIINLSHNCQQVYKDALARKLTLDEYLACGQSPTPDITAIPTPVVIYKTQDTAPQSHGMNCQPMQGVWPPGQMNCTSY